MSKICVVNIHKEGQSPLFAVATEKVLEKVRRPDTEVTIKFCRRAPASHAQLANPYGLFLCSGEIIERILEADKEGHDAVVVNGTLDRYLGIHQARVTVAIPVISPSESTMHFACMLGRRFGIVALGANYLKPLMESIIQEHGLQERAIPNPVKFMIIKHQDLMTRAMQEPSLIVPDVVETAKRCVEDGAEVIILVGTNLGVACTLAGLASVNVDGLEVPLLDPLVVAFKTAETMVDLKTKLGLPAISRAGMYRLVSKEDLKGVRAQFGVETD